MAARSRKCRPRSSAGPRCSSDDESLVASGSWFQWHYDRWQMPPGAVEIARNPSASQAFVLGRNLAVQFHPEITPQILADWLETGGDEQAARFGLDGATLLQQTREQRRRQPRTRSPAG